MTRLIRTSAQRDLRVDLARGVALLFIFIDHIPGNQLNEYTLRNLALCDATEAFVLLAGYAAGLSYGATADKHGWIFAAADVLRRTATLYVAHILVFVLVTAQVGYSAELLNPAYVEEMLLDPFVTEPYRALLEALLLRYQPNLLNILPLYVALLLMLAPALALRRHPLVLMALSIAGYVAVRITGLNLPNWIGGGWFLNPFAWQVLFFTGCVLGYAPPGGRPLAVPRIAPLQATITAGAMLVTLLGAAAMLAFWAVPDVAPGLPGRIARVLSSIDKTGLHPLRLLSILSLAWLVAWFVPFDAAWLRGRLVAPLILMGQQGLPVFCAGILLSFLGRVVLEQDDSALAQAATNLIGFAALAGVAMVNAWFGRAARSQRRPPAEAPADASPLLVPPPSPARESHS
ncbi:OpgC domain-containing protein [Roseomonas sp. M0104]|uniref:OpgC domain-containing protein n=1 Tax=Teichococcus coralli TaxID=2545983 RepID=A0A845B7R7_9PROT|nr:OpgC domain-containing protein [Pseudoroseomonas coralli]MXP62114.1 OpgC domain-containing protein [Pseudoroseomonas coralli]